MSNQSARCAWEVTAGLIPGQSQPNFTRRWGLTSEEWESKEGLELFFGREGEASGYARYLQVLCCQGRAVNWVRIDFIWF
jgi:hypothetical protein